MYASTGCCLFSFLFEGRRPQTQWKTLNSRLRFPVPWVAGSRSGWVTMMKESMGALRNLERQLFGYRYADALFIFDEAAIAPPHSEAGRAVAAEALSAARFALFVRPEVDDLLKTAATDAETEQEKAEVRELRREYDRICRIPAEEYAAFTGLVQRATPAWQRAKRDNDFSAFAPFLEQIVSARRRQANYIDPGKDPYDVLLDQYEPGLTMARCDAFFALLREHIVPLLQEIRLRGEPVRVDFLQGNWPLDAQRELSRRIMQLWGLEPEHCIIGESEHPFTDDLWRGDVRITTHYREDDFTSSLFSVMHEGGHSLYERHIDPAYDFTTLAGGSSMGLHESQSRLFENYVGRSRSFIGYLWPTLVELFPRQLSGVTAQEFYRAVNRAQPGLIRTEADELTYPLHIMVRYELEKALIHGDLAVQDLPGAWNAQYREVLGLTPPTDTEGVLQDIHWAGGDIGYFPSYALGSAYAAQALDDLRRTMDLDAQWAGGDLEPLKAALTDRLWKYGCLKETDWLVKSLCGGDFDPEHYIGYLTQKYTQLYGL